MAHKSKIRQEIERILGHEFNWCYIDPRKGKGVKVRMKFVTHTPATQKQIDQIMKLPHVVKVGYADTKNYSYCAGITVHLSEYTSNIDVEVKPYIIIGNKIKDAKKCCGSCKYGCETPYEGRVICGQKDHVESGVELEKPSPSFILVVLKDAEEDSCRAFTVDH